MTEADPASLVEEIARLLGWREEFTPEKDWSDVERELRTPLPVDYKELLNRFPGGVFRGVGIYSPVVSVQAWIEYKRDLEELLEILGDEDLEYLTGVDYGLFPEPGGLLPWGTDGQGGTLCWITASTDPDTWKIAYHDQGADEWREHPGPATQLLYEILANTGEANLLKWDFAGIAVAFIASRTR